MPIITNESEARKYMELEIKKSMINVQNKVYMIIDKFIKEYYSDYDPVEYIRTKAFYNSLVKSDIRKVRNGYECDVYIDLDSMDYYRHDAYVVVDMINRGYHAWSALNGGTRRPGGVTQSGRPLNDPYYTDDILVELENGEGRHFWDDSIEIFKKGNFIINSFIQYMRNSGIKIVN